jgi:hypothetical protein
LHLLAGRPIEKYRYTCHVSTAAKAQNVKQQSVHRITIQRRQVRGMDPCSSCPKAGRSLRLCCAVILIRKTRISKVVLSDNQQRHSLIVFSCHLSRAKWTRDEKCIVLALLPCEREKRRLTIIHPSALTCKRSTVSSAEQAT